MDRPGPITTLPRVRWTTRVVLPVGAAVLLGLAMWPLDRPLYDVVRSFRPSGDLRRELETLGQFGSLGTMLVAALFIVALDRARTRRLLDWGFAALLGTLVFQGMKVLLGRGRPVLGDPHLFLGPVGEHTEPSGEVLTALSGASELHSMPSSHTTHAVIAAVFLSAMYPRARWLVFAWAGFAGFSRMLHGAHWPSDVVVGAMLAYPLAHLCVSRFWGVRLIDWLWITFIDKGATPEAPRVIEREQAATS